MITEPVGQGAEGRVDDMNTVKGGVIVAALQISCCHARAHTCVWGEQKALVAGRKVACG